MFFVFFMFLDERDIKVEEQNCIFNPIFNRIGYKTLTKVT